MAIGQPAANGLCLGKPTDTFGPAGLWMAQDSEGGFICPAGTNKWPFLLKDDLDALLSLLSSFDLCHLKPIGI